jgi:hypothetical protein
MATLSGLNGESPAAMLSAFTNSLQSSISGKIAISRKIVKLIVINKVF